MPRSRTSLVRVTAWLAALAGSGPSSAHAGGPSAPRGWFLPLGLSASYLAAHAQEGRTHGAKLGAEFSAAYTRDALWYGLYGDVTWEVARDRAWLSLGPEFGSVLLGIDAGAVLVASPDGACAGLRLRAVGNLPYWPDYSKLQYFLGGGVLLSGEPERFLELGILVKLGNRIQPRGPDGR